MMKFLKNNLLWCFILCAIALRFHSFFSSVLDHDESTYMIIGRDVLAGKDLYVDITDTKPPGIFIIYAFFQFLVGSSIFLKRLLVAVLVGVTAYLVSKVSLKVFREERVAIASGAIYLLYTSIWKFFGLSPNTELFFNFFTILGFFLLLQKGVWQYALAGLAFGLGFIIKYMVLFDFMALAGFFLIYDWMQERWRIRPAFVVKHILCGIGFLLPFALVNLHFYLGDHFDAFRYLTYELPGKYLESKDVSRFLLTILELIGRFFPISVLFFYVLLRQRQLLSKPKKWMFSLWIAAVFVAMYLPGKGFHHYFIQLMLPLSLLAGLAFHPELRADAFSEFILVKKVGQRLMIGLVGISVLISIIEINYPEDTPRKVAAYLKDKVGEKDVIYTGNSRHIIYYLLGKDSPTVYLHGGYNLYGAFGVNMQEELKGIMALNPKYIVIRKTFPELEAMMGSRYVVEQTFEKGRVKLFRLSQ